MNSNLTSSPTVVIVILNWNGWKDTCACLESLLPGLDRRSAAVVVCDNASTDNSVAKILQLITASFPDWGPREPSASSKAPPIAVGSVSIIENGSNLGFAGGNNPGIRAALMLPDCRYVWLLNNDTVVNKDSLVEAVSRMEADPSIGICGSTLLYHHDPNLVQAFGGASYSSWTGRSRHVGAFESRGEVPIDPDVVEAKIDYVIGAAMLVRREFVESVGLMQEDYFLYFEEADWARRARGKFRLGYAPRSLVWHKEGASIGTSSDGGSPLSQYFLFRNRIKFCLRFHAAKIPVVLGFCVIDIAKMLIKRRWTLAFAALRGITSLTPPRPQGV